MQLPGYIGDFRVSKTVRMAFQTDVGGIPTTLSGGTVSVYKNASLVQTVSGVSLTADYDGLSGLNHVAVDLSADGSFYTAQADFMIILTAGSVGGVDVFPLLLGQFSIENRSALMPSTADRKLTVTEDEEAVVTIPAEVQTEIADVILNRDMSAVNDTNTRSPLNALRFLRNKWSIAAGLLTVTKENDSTSAWTAAITTSSGNPVSTLDPSA